MGSMFSEYYLRVTGDGGSVMGWSVESWGLKVCRRKDARRGQEG